MCVDTVQTACRQWYYTRRCQPVNLSILLDKGWKITLPSEDSGHSELFSTANLREATFLAELM